jgi:hypothetical protein
MIRHAPSFQARSRELIGLSPDFFIFAGQEMYAGQVHTSQNEFAQDQSVSAYGK